MTHRKFLKRMFDLTVRLTDAVEHDGYQSDAYNEVLEEIAKCGAIFNRSRRRRPWFIILVILFWLLAFVILVSSILLPIQF